MLDRLAALAGAATPGPWMLATSNSYRRFVTEYDSVEVCAPTKQSDGHPDLHFSNPADAAFIAACDPTTILALVAVAKAAKAMLAVETEPAGMTPAIVADKAQFTAFMDDCEKRVAEARDALRSALKSVEPGQP